ncbi:hypothetical protein Tco_0873066 [Tanacetum coccineum]
MSQKRAIISHDVRAISRRKVAEGVEDYLDLKGASEITRMFPSRRSKDRFSDFNLQDLSSTYESYIAYKGQNKVVVPATSRSTEHVSGPIKYSDDLYVWRTDDTFTYVYKWLLHLATFTFSDNGIIIEYTPNPARFTEL